jgi:hypothetical protein
MKQRILVLQIVMLLFILGCGLSKSNSEDKTDKNKVIENKETINSENNVKKVDNEDYSSLIIGSWYNNATASGEDIAFMKDGTFSYYSAGKEDNGTWKIEGDKLRFFDIDYKIIELTKEKLVIEDKYGKVTYEKME